MTINKSQVQFFKNIEIDPRIFAFGHGQLYVVLSQCTLLNMIKNLYIYIYIIS